jgi:hypothetical protein
MLNRKTVLALLLLLDPGGVTSLSAADKPLLNFPGAGDLPMLAETGNANDGPSPSLFDNAPPDPVSAPVPAAPSPNATVNLIRILVKKKVLGEDEANEMIRQAEEEAALARAQAAGVPAADADGAVRVTYVPEIVKNQIRDELKQDVLAQARSQGWAAPNQVADWTKRIKLFGDVRVRYQGSYFPSGNDNTGAFPNFNAINTGAPFDVAGTNFSPQYNVDQDRQRMVLRTRLGADVNLENGWSAGIRIGTGQDNSPVTQNQPLGVANNGQGGNFSKYALWLDRAFIRYDIGGPTFIEESVPGPDGKMTQVTRLSHESPGQLSLLFGRFDNPFLTTSRIIWEDEIGFDGLAFKGRYKINDHVAPFLTAGLFPFFNTDFNFSTNQPNKFQSTDKWLYAAQLGVDLNFTRNVAAKLAGAYYDFQGAEGKLSAPFIPLTPQDQGNTDDTRPAFAQKGNTYRALRSIIPDALNDFGASKQYQYFGLATPFEVLAWTGRIDLNHFEPVQISLLGEYAMNLAFDKNAINEVAVNNRGPLPPAPASATTPADGSTSTAPAPTGSFDGGNTAWNVALKVGKPVFEKAGDWNLTFGYRHVESDAVIDGFVDSDFSGGGTNVKGYTVGGSVALSPRVKFGVLWMGANQIAGPPLKSDVLLLDLSAKF